MDETYLFLTHFPYLFYCAMKNVVFVKISGVIPVQVYLHTVATFFLKPLAWRSQYYPRLHRYNRG